METVKLGGTGVDVGRLTLAARSFAGPKGPLGEHLSADEVVRAYDELGFRSFVATPRMTEMVEGLKRLDARGAPYTLISLAGLPSAGALRRFVERTERAFEGRHVDVLLMGWVQGEWYLRGSVWELMQEMLAAGRVRAVGFSAHDRPLALRLATHLSPPPGVLMLRYNAAHLGAEAEVLAKLPEPRPGIIGYTATRWGELLLPRPELGFERGMEAHECYRFALAHPKVDTVLCAARTYAELEEDVRGLALGPLSPERVEEVLRFGAAIRANPTHHPARYGFAE